MTWRVIDFVLDLRAPHGAAAMRCASSQASKPSFCRIGLQTLGKWAPSLSGVGDEDAQWFRRRHWLRDIMNTYG